jgi:pilus assembly protein CpaF
MGEVIFEVRLPESAAPAALTSAERASVHEALIVRMNQSRVQLTALPPEELEAKTREAALEVLHQRFGNRAQAYLAELMNDVLGLGPLEPLLADPAVTEIMVNGPDHIYVEKNGKLSLSGKTFLSDQHVRDVIERIVMPLGRRIDDSSPIVDARLKDGSRVNAIIPPLALTGPTLTIRKFSKRKLTPDDLLHYNSASPGMIAYLRDAVRGRQNILISGGTGSGKTTLLNILSSFIPEEERIVTVEDAAELKLDQAHVVSLEARPRNVEGKGEVTIRDLVRNCLRMRPDRIVVGECRGGEALDMLQAMNTGHDGSLTTGHANTPADMVRRLETMVLMSGVELPMRAIREQIASAVQVIVQQTRLPDGSRKIVSIAEVAGMEGDAVALREVFRYNRQTEVFEEVTG